MTKPKPKMVYDTINITLSYIPLKDLLPQIQEWINEYGEDASIDIREEHDYYQAKLEFQRLETDLEAFHRSADKRRAKVRRKEQYKKLKKEFEK